MYRFLAKLYPKKIREGYINLMRHSGVKVNADKFVGFITVFTFLLALTIIIYLSLYFKIPFLLCFIGLFFLLQILIYFWLILKADAKAKFVEGVLPDVLQLMSSNLRAGLTTDKALLLSARPEFGPFEDEINQVGKEITTGKEIGHALLDMTKRIKSEKLSKSMTLIVSGLKSGGKLSSLLDQTSRNLRREELVDSRIRANVMMYVIFIFIAVCFGAPLLFGLSSFLVEVLTKIIGQIDLPETSVTTLSISFTQTSITVDFVIMFAVIFLTTSSILGSIVIGLISKGREREGIKFAPILVILSLTMFFLVRLMMGSFRGLFDF